MGVTLKTTHREARKAHDLSVSKKEIHVVEVEYCQDTRAGHQLEVSREQHEIIYKGLKAKKSFNSYFLM